MNKTPEKKDERKNVNPAVAWALIAGEIVVILVVAFIVWHLVRQ